MTVGDLNALDEESAERELLRCCGSARWARTLAAKRPFATLAAVAEDSDAIWRSLDPVDWLEAFAAHPKIGERAAATGWAATEQAAATDSVASDLAAHNQAYLDRFGFLYIVCATGRSPASMLDELRARVTADRDTELRTAAEEQAKITRLRLGKLMEELA